MGKNAAPGSAAEGDDTLEGNEKTGENASGAAEVPAKRRVPAICKNRFCRPCRLLCFASPNKPRTTCVEIFCPTYLAARREAARFKIGWAVLAQAERTTQRLILALLLCFLLLYLCVSGFVPFTFYSATINSQGGCEGSSSFMVYGAYGGLFALSTV